MDVEIWLPTTEFPNHYDVSSFGRVRNKKGHIMAQETHKTYCKRVRLWVDGKKFSKSVHRLVANAFLPNPEDKPEVNHIDGDRCNNKLSNLEWSTKEENMKHAVDTGLIDNPFGKDARNSKFKTYVYDLLGNLLHITYGNEELAQLGFDYRNVHAVITGKQKTHRKHTFKREEK